MKLYRTTTTAAAAAILREGFRDAGGRLAQSACVWALQGALRRAYE